MSKEKIDIFFHRERPNNHRWDTHKNGKLLNIVFHGGTFGNFLKFFLDKFSKLTPDLKFYPFTDIGTSHSLKKEQYSGLIQRYHPSFINDNHNETDLPICLILPNTEKDFLFLKLSQFYKGGDQKILPDNLWQKEILENKKSPILNDAIDNITSFYNISMSNTYIPKFIVRDWYKLEFLENLKDTYNYKWFETLKNHSFFKKQKVHFFCLDSFYNFDIFLKNITELDNFFNLHLDFTRVSEMKYIFMEGIRLDFCRQHLEAFFKIIDNLSIDKNILIPKLDVSFEAFLYAHLEKIYPFVIAPLTNYFFKDTDEIRLFVQSYPEHYKAMNPNLPKFNGNDNPFYLWNLKNKS